MSEITVGLVGLQSVRVEWRVLHGGGVDAVTRTCGTDEQLARDSARIWGGTVQSRTVVESEWAADHG